MNKQANKNKISNSQRPSWIKRQLGGCIEIQNRTGYISKPCLECKYELIRYDLKVTYKDENMNIVTKHAKDIEDSKLTSYRKKVVSAFKKKS